MGAINPINAHTLGYCTERRNKSRGIREDKDPRGNRYSSLNGLSVLLSDGMTRHLKRRAGSTSGLIFPLFKQNVEYKRQVAPMSAEANFLLSATEEKGISVQS